eukprot:7072816-Alexandrium_andersonii.AAC.1
MGKQLALKPAMRRDAKARLKSLCGNGCPFGMLKLVMFLLASGSVGPETNDANEFFAGENNSRLE